MAGLALVTPAQKEPVSLTLVKSHCRVPHELDDLYLKQLISRAREYVEKTCARALITQTWDLFADRGWPAQWNARSLCWQRRIRVPKPPLQSVVSIKYLDVAGVEQTLDPGQYIAEPLEVAGSIVQAYNATWPDVRAIERTIVVRFVAGYGADETAIPPGLTGAMLLMIGHWYSNREAVNVGNIVTPVPLSATDLLAPHQADLSH